MRQILYLVVGLLVGAVGAVLITQSAPPPEGSPEEQVVKLEVKLKHAENRIVALEAGGPRPQRRSDSTTNRVRALAEDIRLGRDVSPDDILRAAQPLLHDLSPLFDRMRVLGETQQIESRTGELARLYDLDATAQERLKAWFTQRQEEEAKRYSDVLAREDVTMMELMKASMDVRPDDGLDEFMSGILSGTRLQEFRAQRLVEKAESVQNEADRKLARLDAIVGLDDRQRDQVFTIAARNSRDYDPAMQFEGITAGASPAISGSSEDAILAVLRPDQREAWDARQAERRAEAEEEMRTIGLKLPDDWELLDDNGI